jgi:Xaa-Pro aminopeptidase
MILTSIYAENCNKLIRTVELPGSGAFLVSSPANARYLSGFSGSNAKLVITNDKRYLMTDFRYLIQAAQQAPDFEIVAEKRGAELEQLHSLLKHASVSVLAYEDDKTSVSLFGKMQDALPGIAFKGLGGAVEKIRMIKSEDEVACMRQAAGLADDAFEHVLKLMKPGVSEADIAAEITYYFNRHASSTSFDTIVASGPNSAMCHATPSSRRLEHGDMVVMDFGCQIQGYASDMTRTVAVGKPATELAKIYQIVFDAQRNALESLSAGKKASSVDSVARDFIAKHGYGDHFGHGLGHGVGLEIHEEPRLSPTCADILEPGMAVTVEPGIYVEDVGGVRIEDLCVLTKNGYENLTRSKKELIQI